MNVIGPFAKKLENLLFSEIVVIGQTPFPSAPVRVVCNIKEPHGLAFSVRCPQTCLRFHCNLLEVNLTLNELVPVG